LPVLSSRALTLKIPLASTLNVTCTRGIPLGAFINKKLSY